MLAAQVRARAQPHPCHRTLSEEECAEFWHNGYLTVQGLLTEDELQELDIHSRALSDGQVAMIAEGGEQIGQHEFPREIDHPAGRASLEENKYFRFIQFHRYLPLHEHYMLHPRVLDVLECLIGPDIMAMQSMLFLKPPQQPGQGYHQDSKYITTFPDLLCGVWIASECLTGTAPLALLPRNADALSFGTRWLLVDDANVRNGCMRFIAGSHSEPELRAQDTYSSDPAVSALHASGDYSLKLETCLQADEDAASGREIVATATRGEVMVFHGHLLHASRRNNSNQTRRAFVCHYSSARSETDWGGGHSNHILARGSSDFVFSAPKFGNAPSNTTARL